MIAVASRIILRYVAAALVTYGLMTSDIGSKVGADPDILIALEVGLGAAIAGLTEAWYFLAKRWGSAK